VLGNHRIGIVHSVYAQGASERLTAARQIPLHERSLERRPFECRQLQPLALLRNDVVYPAPKGRCIAYEGQEVLSAFHHPGDCQEFRVWAG